MTGPAASQPPRPVCRPRLTALAGVLILGLPAPGAALNTSVDYRDTRQDTRIGLRAFSTYAQRSSVTVRSSARLRQPWLIDGSFRVTQNRAGSDASGLQLDQERWTYQPAVTLSYRTSPVNGGLRGTWRREDTSATGLADGKANQDRYAGWLNADLTESTDLSTNLAYTRIRNELTFGDPLVQNALTGFLRADQGLSSWGRFRYRLTGSSSNLISREIQRNQWTNDLDLTVSPRFIENRLSTYVRARSRFLSQRVETGTDSEASLYRAPLAARVILDSTPGTHDPLEDPGVSAPNLFDGDLENPTAINIGDDAPVVLEWGGDYRNLRYDFGEAEMFASAILYVDTRLLVPDLFGWRVFVTDDPTARVWTEVPPASATVLYREWGTNLQGWEITLAPGVTGRFLKLVDVKFGQTIPDLFVTEMEVYVRETTEVVGVTRKSQRHDLDGRFGFDVTSALNVGYTARLQRRISDDERRNLDKMRHMLTATYRFASHGLHAQIENNTLTSDFRRNTDVMNYQLSARRDQNRRVSGVLAWSRTEDRTVGRELNTDALSLTTNWAIFPRLRFRQTLSHGRHEDYALDLQSRSFVMINNIRGSPLRTLAVDIDWAERWVTENGRVGYDRFTNTRLNVDWTPVPLISLASRSRYQRRYVATWDSRQTLTWSPWPGGAVVPVITGDVYYVSRDSTWQQGVQLLLTWRVKSGLRAEGSVYAQRFNTNNGVAIPVTTFLHVTWNI